MGAFLRSDLAAECDLAGDCGVLTDEREADGCHIFRVHVRDEEAAARLGKPRGHYVTLTCGDVRAADEQRLFCVRRALAVELREMAARMAGKSIGRGFRVLVAGLGNGRVIADAVGPETVRRLSVTRHVRRCDDALFATLGLCEIAAICPGIPGQTGMETVEVVRGAAENVRPDLVVAVDALAARDTERLLATVQLADTGIHPGSGVGNGRGALNGDTVGFPVLGLGVPTVVESATLVADAMQKAGMAPDEAALSRALRGGRNYFVTPDKIDLLVPAVATLLASSLEKAFSVG